MIVYKFGGSTTRTPRGLETLAGIVQKAHANEMRQAKRSRASSSTSYGLIVVVSAIGHTTRKLNRAAELSVEGNTTAATEQIAMIVQTHSELLHHLHLPENTIASTLNAILKISADVSELLEGIAITRELSARTRDNIASAGEQFAIAIIESLLRSRNIPVQYVPARTIIVTDEAFGRATPIISETKDRAHRHILHHLNNGNLVLIDGFVSATREKIITTMGTESSDLTATLLASVLDASEVVIWKSVAGIFNADPELVPSARLINSLSFAESEEIGKRGARVLFSKAAGPLIALPNEIPLRIAAPKTFAVTASRAPRGTTIRKELSIPVRTPRALAVAIESHLVCLQITRHNHAAPKESKSAVDRLAQIQSRALYSYTSEDTICFVLKASMKSEVLQLLENSKWSVHQGCTIVALSLVLRLPENDDDKNAALASKAISGVRQQMLRALRGFNVLGFFSMERSLVALVEDAQSEKALRKVHHDFFG